MSVRKKKIQSKKPPRKKKTYVWTRGVKNSLIIKEKDRKKSRDMLVFLLFAALFGGMLLILVWLRFQPLFTGYEIQALKLKKQGLIEEHQKLLCSRENLRTLGSIEEKAADQLEMKPIDPGQTIYVELIRDEDKSDSESRLIAAMTPVDRAH